MKSRGLTVSIVALLLAAIALGGYVYYLKRAAEQRPAPATAPSSVIIEPVSGKMTAVTLYEASDGDGGLHSLTRTLVLPDEKGHRARTILRALTTQYRQAASLHRISAQGEVLAVYVVNNNLAIVDVETGFASGHRSGIMVEELTMASMAKTLAANVPGVTRMKVLIEGQERQTLAGHADLIEPYEAAAADVLVKK